MTGIFFINSALLGVGLAMDAFSVSLANGLNDSKMKLHRMFFIAGIYAFFQFFMPMIGWVCVHTICEYFTAFQPLVPWIALVLLLYIGIKMIVESLNMPRDPNNCNKKLTIRILLIQGIATSIDALSVGFTIAGYQFWTAFIAAMIIAIVTFVICVGGLYIGKKAGTRISGKAELFGGTILVIIGIEIFVKGALL